MKLYEVFERDPRTAQLANNGQARITGQTDAKATAELRAELETFVCEGQFARAIQLIVERYLGNLGHTKQDSAWVSGFFGSGKSHLLKMLTHLWENTELEDGSTARSLVRGGLTDEVEAHLRELDTQARRTTLPVVAAAGTMLGGTDRVRETVLSILLRTTGWPTQYPQATFCFWLRDQGWLDSVRAEVEGTGRDWLHELNNLFVSPHIRRALLQVDPNLAPDEKGVSQVLRNQFPQLSTDITTAQFTEAAKEALVVDGQLPLTLVVLDEVQQYINEASDRAAIITEVAEALQTQFGSRVMLVAAGQSALSAGTQALMWLRDRFKISIELADADVEAVTRKVLLHKKPSAGPAIEALLETNAGEIARHLQGTKIGEKPEDRRDWVADYPLLPTRRRFWEACFQAADAAGTHSQLRSQLRILHDALHEIAERDLGAVLPASDLFNALAPALVNTGVLLNEINTRIQKLDDGSAEGRLRRDLCGLVFLVGKLPREAGVDLGVRADARTLADLMVDDVRKDSGPFRKTIEEQLEALADGGTLMKVGTEYRLQTTEGAEWDRTYRQRQGSLGQNEVEIATRRDHIFGQQVQQIVTDIKLPHGQGKIRRTLSLHTGSEAPRSGGDHVTVWLRDGWSTSEKDFASEARRLGQDDPTLHVHLPKKSADDLKARIIDAEAARQVLDHYGSPSTPEGIEAREGMESRLRVAEAARDEIIRDVIRAARVLQGGGSEVFGESLADKIKAGAGSSLARLFPRFDDGDHRAWEVAVKRAKDGSDEPFKVVGWDQATEEHPVAKEVLVAIGAGAKGTDVQKTLKSAPYGWPQDAIDAALVALHRSGHLRASKNRVPISVGALDQASIKAAEFHLEKIRLTTGQRIALRGLFDKVGVVTKSGEEELRAPDFLEALGRRAADAGGDAPLPPAPDTTLLEDLRRLAGTEQLGALLDHKDGLEKNARDWEKLAERAVDRRQTWALAEALRKHAEGLPVLDEVGPELDAILAQRSLLADTDQITPLVNELAGSLRKEVTRRHTRLAAAVDAGSARLNEDATWTKISASEQDTIKRAVGLVTPAPLSIGTDSELQRCLDHRSLTGWLAEIDAIDSRVARALEEAATLVKAKHPEIVTTQVTVRRGTLSDAAEVQAWIEEHGRKLKEAVANGPVIVS